MSSKTTKVLNFLRLIDENKTLSISNLAVITILVKLAVQPCFDLAGAAVLLTAIGNYAFKSYNRPRRTEGAEEAVQKLTEEVKRVSSSVEKLKMRAGFVE